MRKNLLLKQNSERRTTRSFRPKCRVAVSSKYRLRTRNADAPGHDQRSQRGTFLVPIDFTETSHKALDYALSMAAKLNRSVTLVHVLERSYGEGFLDADQKEDIRAKARLDSRIKLNALAQRKHISDVPVACIVSDGLPEYEILRIAEDLKVELIILGRQNRSPLSRLIFGSVTADVVDAAACPVLVVNNSGSVPHENARDCFTSRRRSNRDDRSHKKH